MSKIGKTPVVVPRDVSVVVTHEGVTVKSAKGELHIPSLPGIMAEAKDGEVVFSLARNNKQMRSNWGTMRALVYNAVQGLTEGFSKTLLLEGVGFRIVKEGENLVMNLGFSHPIRYTAPAGITFEVEKNTTLVVKGFDKALVGQVAAEIRAFRKPEPYKGTGFRYIDEVVRRKAGKKAVAAAGGPGGA